MCNIVQIPYFLFFGFLFCSYVLYQFAPERFVYDTQTKLIVSCDLIKIILFHKKIQIRENTQGRTQTVDITQLN